MFLGQKTPVFLYTQQIHKLRGVNPYGQPDRKISGNFDDSPLTHQEKKSSGEKPGGLEVVRDYVKNIWNGRQYLIVRIVHDDPGVARHACSVLLEARRHP